MRLLFNIIIGICIFLVGVVVGAYLRGRLLRVREGRSK
jgi:hypothetical protein